VVLKHLRRYRPSWNIDVRAGQGKHTALIGLCRRVYHDREGDPKGPYDKVYDLGWWENYNRASDRPNTKVTNCLTEVFGLGWDRELGRYEIERTVEKDRRALDYLLSCGCRPADENRVNAVLVHYEGNTSQGKKNLDHDDARALCVAIQDAGFVPIVLDWDKRSPLPDQKYVFNPGVGKGDLWGDFGSGDAATIASLIAQSSLFVGVDSGPQKCAATTETPAIGVWKQHQPIQFMDPAPNFLHLIPGNFRDHPPCQDARITEWMIANYRLDFYPPDRMREKLVDLVFNQLKGERKRVNGLIETCGFWVPEHRPEQSFVIIDDVYRQDAYRTALRPKKDGVEYVVDLGANIGCFSRLWRERNPLAKIVAVECCQECLEALRMNVGSFAEIVHAACHYSQEELFLLNSFTIDGKSTGGSRVVGRDEMDGQNDCQYRKEPAPLEKITLEQIMKIYEFPRIDILKLDVEGSEFSILENCDLSRVGTIFMESHGHEQFLDLLKRRFKGWDIGHMSRNGDFSNWHIVSPEWRKD
jgi:FkbM family methyltransferase